MVLKVKNMSAKAGDVRDTGSIPSAGRTPWRGGNGPAHSWRIFFIVPWTEKPGEASPGVAKVT